MGEGKEEGVYLCFNRITNSDARNVNTLARMYHSISACGAPQGARGVTSGFKAVNIFTLTRFLPHYFPKDKFSFTYSSTIAIYISTIISMVSILIDFWKYSVFNLLPVW